jgi:hypothetical protein
LSKLHSGGFFAGKIPSESEPGEAGGRFDPNSRQGAMYRARYLKAGYFEALEYLKTVAVSDPPSPFKFKINASTERSQPPSD